MIIARVTGNAISTVCHPTLKGWRLLVCQPLGENGISSGHPILALDNLGAGNRDRVIITSDGKSVREKLGSNNTPARYMTIGILDSDHDELPVNVEAKAS